MNTIKIVRGVLVMTMLLLISGCSRDSNDNITEPTYNESLSITMHLNVAVSNGFHVTRVSATIERDDFSESIDLTISGNMATGTFTKLQPGTYTISLEVYDDDTLIATGSEEGEVVAGKTTTVNIELQFYVGNLEITVTWEGGRGELLFEDDFGDDLSQWEVVTGTWYIQNDQLVGIGHGGDIDAWIYAGDESWTDYEVSAKVYFNNGPAEGNGEIVLRSTGHWQNEYRISVFPQQWRGNPNDMYTNRYRFACFKDGEETFDGEHELCPFPITNPADIKVEAIGNEIRLYINETFVDSLIDPNPLTNGRFGLGVIWAEQSRYDDVVVRQR